MFERISDDICELMFVHSDNEHSPKTQKLSSKGSIPHTWILIDSQSTIDIFCNGGILTKIRRVHTTIHIRCNTGINSTNMRGRLSGYGWVRYFPEGIVNILSLSWVKEKFRVTFDSAMDNCFHVHKEGKVLKFCEATQRLYYFDTTEQHEESTMLISMVDINKSKFSAYDFSRAKLARTLQCRNGRPANRDFIHYVENNLIPNCPVTTQDIRNAEFIWGPDLGSLKGKTI